MVIGNAFTCKGAGGDWGCLRVFHYAEKEMRVEQMAGRAFFRPNPDASRGAQLLKVLQMAGTPRLALAVALTEVHTRTFLCLLVSLHMLLLICCCLLTGPCSC
jgi:hypothetical protein